MKKFYPNSGVYQSNYFNPNVYLYPEQNPYYSTYPRLFNEPSVYEYQNINKDENLRNEVIKFFSRKNNKMD